MAAQLGQGWRHALVVPRGAQEVIEDLQDGANVTPRSSAAVLAIGVQRACRGQGVLVSAQGGMVCPTLACVQVTTAETHMGTI